MPSNRLTAVSGFVFLLLGAQVVNAAELMTLFTTPEERHLINSNRYKSDEVKAPAPVVVEEVEQSPIQQMFQEEVSREYKISGISVSQEGSHTVWINSTAYEDGEQLEDNSKIKVMLGDEIRVRITAPDGKHHYATSGETMEVTYMATVSN
ncbi:MAG: hypothetical protein GY935_24425 [Gammaproteobacteria bacterium]|nr:hypothetical protein [Gammaproteobacteria bacterium]